MLCIGLMSGTSMDGVDAVLMETDGRAIISVIAVHTINYPNSFKLSLREEETKVKKAKRNIATTEIINLSTHFHALAVEQLLKKTSFVAEEIDLIGYHGQSLYHNPAEKITIQIGDGELLANLTRINVINDFRSSDIVNGGQGAPLAPLYHKAILENLKLLPATIVNCGGISNISIITKDKAIGFDTGPGNVLLDRLVRQRTNNQEFYDCDGKYSSKGVVNDKVLELLIDNFSSYLNKESPKSLDPNDFTNSKELDNLDLNDAAATLAKFTAYCIVNSIKIEDLTKSWILAGGGWNNPSIKKFLDECLKSKIPEVEIKTADQVGLNSTYMEAEIFAYLAARSYLKLPITLSSVTGASCDGYGGTFYIHKS